MTTNKKNKLRNNEYYDAQEMFDKLYENSKKGYEQKHLYELICSEQNILLAYRNIKRNTGSKTAGTDGKTIAYLEQLTSWEIVDRVRKRLENYHPKSVRRVEIPKANGKTRPLGIPCIEERLIQQCFKQILEPICEAKFHPDSYGFRPNRSTSHAIARVSHHINMTRMYYCVDIDIKSFFDNVDHSKLLKQLWTIGIHDKKVISIISKMLKAEIHGVGIPTKGVPQGGILSPLLANVALNELDWWISDQWQTFKTQKEYSRLDVRYRAQRNNTKLKPMFIIRYADDFKIMCNSYNTAKKIYRATKMWLDERLHLEISDEKSRITNLRKNYTEFLGFKLTATPKNGKYVAYSHMSDKSYERTIREVKECIKKIEFGDGKVEVLHYNSLVLGLHSYFCIATHVSVDFHKIAFLVKRIVYSRLRKQVSNHGVPPPIYLKKYSKYKIGLENGAPYYKGVLMLPIGGVSFFVPLSLDQRTCNYTTEGRALVHKNLDGRLTKEMRYLLSHPLPNGSVELNDNRISLLVAQNGKDAITGKKLEIGDIEVHHVKPKHEGGTDRYENLILIAGDTHKLIHAKIAETIDKYVGTLKNDVSSLKKLNKYRKLVGNSVISI